MRPFRRPSAVAATLALLANTACYAYQSAAATPRPTAGVRLRLTAEGSTELARYLGPNVVVVTGQLASVLPNGGLSVAPVWIKAANGVELPWNGEGEVSVPPRYVVDLQQRVYHGRRTAVAAAAMTAALVGIAVAALKTGGSQGAGSPASGTPTR